MSTICVVRKHTLDQQALRQLGDKLADKLTQKLGGSCEWRGNELNYQQGGTRAKVTLGEEMVEVNVKLGLMMTAFSSMVESEINRVLDEYLA